MNHSFLFRNLDEFVSGAELHDCDIRKAAVRGTEVELLLDGVFLPAGSPANPITSRPVYAFPSRIIFTKAKLSRSCYEKKEFSHLAEKKELYFEIITASHQEAKLLLEGRVYSDNGSGPSGWEADLEIYAGGDIRVEWGEVCEEG